ncbi:hypothetical protein NPX13_g7437 [Xylaria arbuscula]|uniref:C2H2-type domain-containing protein n=1 Tax=Xylaria arbuscula TaxID=114810 RepID=A0A9W8NAC7_9PEZI|nr:hypothetical protein NPX13_g7437 [Xylaria arbuscula]
MKRSREPEEEYPTDTVGSFDDPQPAEEQEEIYPAAKIAELDESAVDTSSDIAMRCSLPPHRDVLSFTTYGDYEAHYNKLHTNRCADCHKNFPSEHLLNVHFEDCHDVFAAVKREKGEHTNYFFALTKDGIDGRTSLLLDGGHHRRRSSTATTASVSKTSPRRRSLRQAELSKPQEGEAREPSPVESRELPRKAPPAETLDVEMDNLAGAMSSLQFIPTSIKFGRGRGKAGFAKR